MREAPAYSGDRFTADFAVSLLSGVVACLISGPMIWYCALRYIDRSYAGHTELDGAAAFAGLLDGFLIGAGVFVATFAVRVWRYERNERKRSDAMLKHALIEIANESEGR